MTNTLPDISSEEDIRTLVNSFYDLVRKDDLLQPIFDDVAKVNWDEHLPHLCDFWSALLLGTRRFQGKPWPKHAVLPVGKDHFRRWLALFFETVDRHFAGPRAEAAKGFAASIADTFQQRMGLVGPADFLSLRASTIHGLRPGSSTDKAA